MKMSPPELWLSLTELARALQRGCHPHPLHLKAMRSIWVVAGDQLTLLVQMPAVMILPLVVVRWKMRRSAELPLLVPPPLPPPQSPQRPQCSGCHHRECRHGAFLQAMLQPLQCFQCQRAQVEQRGSWGQRLLHVPLQLQVKRPALWALAAEAAASLLGLLRIPLEHFQQTLQQQVPQGNFLR